MADNNVFARRPGWVAFYLKILEQLAAGLPEAKDIDGLTGEIRHGEIVIGGLMAVRRIFRIPFNSNESPLNNLHGFFFIKSPEATLVPVTCLVYQPGLDRVVMNILNRPLDMFDIAHTTVEIPGLPEITLPALPPIDQH